MAALTQVNPRMEIGLDGSTPIMAKKYLLCADNESWKAGQFLHMSSGKLSASASDAVNFKYVALEDQSDTSTGGTTYAKVGRITADMVFEMNILTGSATVANIGVPYALDVTSNVCTVDTGDTGHDCFMITELGEDYNSNKYSSSDTNSKVRVRVLHAVLDA